MPQLVQASRTGFLLAFIIAYRSRWNGGAFNPLNLELGEAAVDYASWGLTRQEFRTALKFLEKHGLATSKSTTKGTVARLIGTRLFDVLPGEPNQQTLTPTTTPATTNQEQKSGKSGKEKKKKAIRPVSPTEPGNSGRPFTDRELQSWAEKNQLVCDRESANWVREWVWTNDEKGWENIRNYRTACKRYVERCRLNARWQAPPYHPGYQDRFSIATLERIYDQD